MRDTPPWAQKLIRSLRLGTYAFASVAGAGVILASTPSASSLFPQIMTNVMGFTLFVFGLLCLLGVLMQRWVMEWISLFFLTAAILVYTVAIWVGSVGHLAKLAGAGAIAMLLAFLLIRIVELTVYWIQNVRVAKIKQELADESDS